MSSTIQGSLFAILMIVAAAGDVLSLRISNRLNLLIAGLFFPSAVLTQLPIGMIAVHVIVGVSMLALGFLLFRMKLIGGGDAKLLAAASLWLGWPAVLPFLAWTAISGGLLGLFIGLRLIFRKYVVEGPAGKQVPYGVALTAGALIALWYHN